LVERLLVYARLLSFRKVRLETPDFIVEANGGYESLGFVRTAGLKGVEELGYGILPRRLNMLDWDSSFDHD